MNQWIWIALAAGAVLLAVAAISIKMDARRLRNGFFLEAGVLFWLYAAALWITTIDGQTALTILRGILYAYYALLVLISVLLIVNYVLLLKKEGFSFRNVLPLLFGFASLTVAIVGFFDVSYGISGSMLWTCIWSFLMTLVLLIPLALGAVLLYSIVYLKLPKKADVDFLVVLGCGLRANGEVTPLLRGRLDKAIEYYHKGKDSAKIIVSGGQGADEATSEAQAMQNYLLSQGIPQEKIILEDKSATTRQNLLNSKAIMENRKEGYSCLICTSNYHVLRAVIHARALGLPGQGIGGKTAAYYLPVAFFREYIAMIFQYKIIIAAYVVLALFFSLKGVIY